LLRYRDGRTPIPFHMTPQPARAGVRISINEISGLCILTGAYSNIMGAFFFMLLTPRMAFVLDLSKELS
jgi:hypothetical protein